MKLKTRTNQPVYYKLPVSSNIQSLSDDLLNSLRVGDVVQKKTGNQKHCYIVSYKEEKHGICLTYVDCGYMETISYDYTNGHWVFNSKDVCEVPSSQDIQEMLVGKYVRIMEAPTSTTLTDEQIECFKKGVFIDGTFLGLINPIILPCYANTEDQPLIGFIFGKDTNAYARSRLLQYSIGTSSKVISLISQNGEISMGYRGNEQSGMYLKKVLQFNDKVVPPYPSNTGTFTLKCVDGTLTWVADE